MSTENLTKYDGSKVWSGKTFTKVSCQFLRLLLELFQSQFFHKGAQHGEDILASQKTLKIWAIFVRFLQSELSKSTFSISDPMFKTES